MLNHINKHKEILNKQAKAEPEQCAYNPSPGESETGKSLEFNVQSVKVMLSNSMTAPIQKGGGE